MKRAAALALAALMCSTIAAKAETIAIVGGTVHTVANPQPIENGTVVVRDGKIVAVGQNVAVPADARVIDASGKQVTPGLFNAFTSVGLADVAGVQDSNDISARSAAYSASIDASYAINPKATPIAVTRVDGVTRLMVTPQPRQSVFGGQGVLIHLGDANDLVFKPRAFQFVALGEHGADVAGGSRPAAFAEFVNALKEARNLSKANFVATGGQRTPVYNRADLEALQPVLNGQMPVVVWAERVADIRQVLRLRTEFPKLRIIIAGAAEGWMVADELAAAKVPVIVNALQNLPDAFERLGSTMNNVGRLARAGVTVALGTMARDEAHQARLVVQDAANLVGQARVPGGTGLSWEEALKTVTLNPAKIFGVDKELGSLEPGKAADVVVWSGDPFDLTQAPTNVLIAGKEVKMESRQTKLRDRYNGLHNETLPFQYRY